VPGDETPPVVTPVITGTLGSAGWYVTNVTVNWTVSDPESLILSTTGCNATTLTANTTGTPLSCTAESDGGTTTIGKTFKIDKTPPAASASPSRSADTNGWYNKPLSVSFAATDGTSGVASCSTPVDYAGPDTNGTPVAGSCRDQAGNIAPAAETVKYDSTAPSATASARPPDANGWFNHAVTVTFQGADATSGVDSCTQQTYAGPLLRLQVRRHGARGDRDTGARGERERLVQRADRRQLLRNRPRGRRRDMFGIQDVFRA
jgi:hypothetical protein